MRTRVKLKIASPIEFRTDVDYKSLGIASKFEDHRLVALELVIVHDRNARREQVVGLAQDKVMRLLALIQYGSGRTIEIASDETHAISPRSPIAIELGYIKLAATLSRSIPLPPISLVKRVSPEVTQQLGWYNSAQNSSWIIEKIRNYFEVLELERYMPPVSSKPYEPPPEAKWLRDAVSHPRLNNPKARNYLQGHLGTDHIDPNNERHLRFLESKVQLIQTEAQRVLSSRVPKWW
jgi:hypothetical protein